MGKLRASMITGSGIQARFMRNLNEAGDIQCVAIAAPTLRSGPLGSHPNKVRTLSAPLRT